MSVYVLARPAPRPPSGTLAATKCTSVVAAKIEASQSDTAADQQQRQLGAKWKFNKCLNRACAEESGGRGGGDGGGCHVHMEMDTDVLEQEQQVRVRLSTKSNKLARSKA